MFTLSKTIQKWAFLDIDDSLKYRILKYLIHYNIETIFILKLSMYKVKL